MDYTYLMAYYTPIVVLDYNENYCLVNRAMILDLPTPESPSMMILILYYGNCYCFICIYLKNNNNILILLILSELYILL